MSMRTLLLGLVPEVWAARQTHREHLRDLARAQAAVLALEPQAQLYSPEQKTIADLARKLADLEHRVALPHTDVEQAAHEWNALAERADAAYQAGLAELAAVAHGLNSSDDPTEQKTAIAENLVAVRAARP